MIEKVGGFQNKYKLTENSNTGDITKLCASYQRFRCIICNAKTAVRFKPRNYVTINNRVEDDMFYVNRTF